MATIRGSTQSASETVTRRRPGENWGVIVRAQRGREEQKEVLFRAGSRWAR